MQAFAEDDYQFNRQLSSDDELVFTSVLKWLRTGKFPRLPRR